MKLKLVILSLFLFPWGMNSQAWGQCTCSDKEAIAINLAYRKAQLAVTDTIQSRFKVVGVVNFAKIAVAEHQAVIKELTKLSIDAGLPPKTNSLEKAYIARADEAIEALEAVPSPELEQAYLAYVNTETQRLITAFETYFIPKAVTQTMKEWTVLHRERVADLHALVKTVNKTTFGIDRTTANESSDPTLQ